MYHATIPTSHAIGSPITFKGSMDELQAHPTTALTTKWRAMEFSADRSSAPSRTGRGGGGKGYSSNIKVEGRGGFETLALLNTKNSQNTYPV